MIRDCSIDKKLLEKFLKTSEVKDFLEPQLIKNNLVYDEYINKLAQKATIAYTIENDEIQGMVAGYTHNTPNNEVYITKYMF